MKPYEERVPFHGTDIPVLTLYPPEDIQIGQRILMVYGGSAEEKQREKIASFWGESLTSLGIILHCFEFRSNLDAKRFRQFGLYDRLEDTREVFRWLRTANGNRDPVSTDFRLPLSIMGVSMGGYLATLVAAENAHRVHALVLVAPAAYNDDACRQEVKFGPAFRRAIRNPPNGWRQCRAFRRARDVTADCLIVTYGNDEIIPQEIPESYATHMHAKRNEVARDGGYSGYVLRHKVLEGFAHRGTFDDPDKRKKISHLLRDFFETI